MSQEIIATAAKAAVTTFMENKPWSTATLVRAGGIMTKALRNLPGTDAEKSAVICKILDTLLDQALAKVGGSNETEAIVLAECKKFVDTILPVTLELALDAGAFDVAKAVQSRGFWQMGCCGSVPSVVSAVAAQASQAAQAAGVPGVSKALDAVVAAAAPAAEAAAPAAPAAPAAAEAAAAPAEAAKAVQNWSGPADVAVVVPGTEQTPPVESANPPVVLAPPEAPAPSEPAAPVASS